MQETRHRVAATLRPLGKSLKIVACAEGLTGTRHEDGLDIFPGLGKRQGFGKCYEHGHRERIALVGTIDLDVADAAFESACDLLCRRGRHNFYRTHEGSPSGLVSLASSASTAALTSV